ncbi:ribonuclease Oy [Drosophila erecta]|uniref:Uncharacterized protein n=1 Tax=Drosophila erecta TaxID=7220 RepID=B3NF74_DROER|nr:ribonuclease Oy [Drosophila erecta]EDV50416.1 uncharacterized protein Dere_GG14458 [Drosophila erecta]
MRSQRFLFVAILACFLATIKCTPLSDISDSDESTSVDEKAQKRPDDYSEFDGFPFRDDDESLLDSSREMSVEDHNWDVLIFTQQWPVTTCYHWREDKPDQECSLPQKKEFWTIHGIWPTKLNQIGPSFCNNSATFDPNKLHPIEDQLETFWPDLKGMDSTEWLWRHEWQKHGTCAMLVEELDSELKYFEQGITWREKYIMSRILDASDIHPDSNNTVAAIYNAIVKALGKNPSIHCLYDGKHGISYLSEIRLCFSKSLELIDCDGVKQGDAVPVGVPGGTIITNCHIGSLVHYPSLVPPLQRKSHWKLPLVNVYKLLQFLMWFTL